MKLRSLIAVATLITVGPAMAASGVFESYGILKVNSTNTDYRMEAPGTPDFDGADLGSFDTSIPTDSHWSAAK